MGDRTRGSGRRELFGDGALMSGGVFLAITAITLGIKLTVAPSLGTEEAPMALNVLVSLLMLVPVALGPLGTWLLHGRRIDLRSIGGMVLGGLVGFAVMTFLPALIGSLFIESGEGVPSDDGLTGLFVMVGLASAAFLALAGPSVLEAVREVRGAEGRRRALHLARLASAVAVLLVAVAAVVMLAIPQAGEGAEILPFTLVFAFGGGFAVLGADLLSAPDTPRSDATST